MVKVIFLGKEYEIDDSAKYIAQDSNGEIFTYSSEPLWDGVEWCGIGARHVDTVNPGGVIKEINATD